MVVVLCGPGPIRHAPMSRFRVQGLGFRVHQGWTQDWMIGVVVAFGLISLPLLRGARFLQVLTGLYRLGREARKAFGE